jgi:putative addiction module killer protein
MEAQPKEIQRYLPQKVESLWLSGLIPYAISMLRLRLYSNSHLSQTHSYMEAQPREIRRYVTFDDRVPFDEWFNSLGDTKAKNKIEAKLERVKLGNLGNYRSVGEGVCELKINSGPGYRIYFGQIGTTIVLLLCGGDKSTQDQDIPIAIEYWKDYRS